jgi:hypothetical protein
MIAVNITQTALPLPTAGGETAVAFLDPRPSSPVHVGMNEELPVSNAVAQNDAYTSKQTITGPTNKNRACPTLKHALHSRNVHSRIIPRM